MNHLDSITQKIREAAKKALKEGKAEVVIGYRQGSAPLTVSPHFARTEEQCDQLIWSDFIKINLANYLSKYPGKVAIVAKGCDARSVVGQVSENQILRENVYIIGVPCQGMVDGKKILAADTRPVKEVAESADSVTLKGDGFESQFKKSDFARRNCLTCKAPTPKTADELVAPEAPAKGNDDYADLKALAAKSPAEKMAYFKDLIKTCLRCYACRNACPLCYCPVCFVDETRPQWLGKSLDEMDTMVFHLLRGMHCAGRCTGCGACEAACPVGIKAREFNRMMDQEVLEQWGYEAGLTWDQKPPLTLYRPDDEAKFIK